MRSSSPGSCTNLYFSSSSPQTFATLHLTRPGFQPTKQPNHDTAQIVFHSKFNASSNCSRLSLVYFIYRGRGKLFLRFAESITNIPEILELLVTSSKDAAEFFRRRKSYCQWWTIDRRIRL